MRTRATVLTILLGAALAGLPVSAATCYDQIQELPCWGDGKKCNIKFRNLTGVADGTDDKQQVASAFTVYVRAVKANGNRAGSNTLSILAGASNTLNLDKKDDFEEIEIKVKTDQGEFENKATMFCAQVLDTLRGSGVCKVYIAEENETPIDTFNYVAFTCDGGAVKGGH